jgi:hypothetical protein
MRMGRLRGRRLAPVSLLAVVLLGSATFASSAHAAVAHEFLPGPSEQISAAIPHGCGTGSSSPPCISGPLDEVTSATVDAGSFWLAERVPGGGSRVDRFSAATGEFSPPQLDEEAEVVKLGGTSPAVHEGIAIGHAGGEEEVYLDAARSGQSGVAVYGPAGTLQPGGFWTGASTPQGVFAEITGVAVSSNVGVTQGDVYVSEGRFVDVFPGEAEGKEPSTLLTQLGAKGATGNGTLENVEEEVEGKKVIVRTVITALSVTNGRFSVGQEVEAPGIPAGTRIEAAECSEPGTCSELRLSRPATATGPVAVTALDEATGVAVSSATGDVIVSHGNEELCVSGGADCAVTVFEPTGLANYEERFTIGGAPGRPFKRIGSIAVDGEGDIYVVEQEENVVDEFSSAGDFLGHITGPPERGFKSLLSIAADQATGDIYVGEVDGEQSRGSVDVFGPGRVVPDVTTTSGEAVVTVTPNGEGVDEAILEGTVDPLGQGDAKCGFVFGVSEAFGRVAPCEPEIVPDGSGAVPVKATVASGLIPDTRYVFRLQASNGNGLNHGESSDDREFVTPGPGIHEQSVVEVSSTAATLGAVVDPHGAPTSYYFEYGKVAGAYEVQAPAAPGVSLGSGEGDVVVPPRHVQGLVPGTLYHYRVVAVSQLQVAGQLRAVVFAGSDQTFSTQGAGEVALADGRAWELVSSPDKHGGALEGNGGPGAVQAAGAGGAVTYLSTGPTDAEVKGNRGQVQVLSDRTSATGWESHDIALPHRGPVSFTKSAEYRLFSRDLSVALIEPVGDDFTSLAPEVFPPDSEIGPYVRHNATCSEKPGTCYQPLLVGCPPSEQACPAAITEYADVPAGTGFGSDPNKTAVDGTPDLANIIVKADVPLTGSLTEEELELYEVKPAGPPAQQVSLVSLVPNETGEEVPAQNPLLGGEGKNLRHAISDDGASVVFTSGSPSGTHLYLRDVTAGKTVQLDISNAECATEGRCGPADVHFQVASADGKRIFFTDGQRLTNDASQISGTSDLYECAVKEVGGAPECDLTDLTPAPGPQKAAAVLGTVIGASEDGSWLYFVANGVLGDAGSHEIGTGDCINGQEVEGQHCNLYVYHDGVIHFIATLDGFDSHSWGGRTGQELNLLTARVSPNGEYLAFMSQLPLTGYDNRDANSGRPDQEVFLYHAESAGTGALICASCNPDGSRPIGTEAGHLSEPAIGTNVWEEARWIAANVPGWTQDVPAESIYQSRYLLNDGRLFFNSDDALVPKDINNNEDVFEYEPVGVGSCAGTSATFDEATDGCLASISAGAGAGESAFLDASESGEDVFFLTGDRLVRRDVDSAVDLYDAHACSAEAPCRGEVEPPANCVTAEACRAAPVPQPGIFGAPSSATFSGAGNITPTVPKVVSKAKARVLTRAQKLAKALTACHAKHDKRRRKSCERQARKRYGPPPPVRARKGSVVAGHGQTTGSRGGR